MRAGDLDPYIRAFFADYLTVQKGLRPGSHRGAGGNRRIWSDRFLTSDPSAPTGAITKQDGLLSEDTIAAPLGF